MKRKLSLGIATLLIGQNSLAQFDDFPPPPPPPPDFNDSGFSAPADSGSERPMENFGSQRSTRTSNTGSGKKGAPTSKESTILPKDKKDKLARASVEDINSENFNETLESFDFPNVEISDVIKAISELTGKNFIIDPGVRGKITIIAPSKITVSEAYKAFLSALAINGMTVVPSGAFLKVKSARNAQRDNIETYSGAYYPNSDQMITRIIHLKHISASQVNRDLRILPSKDGEMNIYEPTNSIIISDYGSNIDRVMKIIGQLDVPGFEEQLEVIPIKNAKSKDLAELVDKIVNKGQKSGQTGAPGSFSAGVPRFTRSNGASGQQGASFFMAIPEDRTNSIIAVGNKPGIVRLKKLIAQLDFKIRPEDSGGVFVYYVKNGDAEKIAQTLNGVAKDTAPKPATGGFGAAGAPQASQEIFGGDVKITADKSTNSLVITASKQDYETVMNLMAKLDIPRDQVFVEAIIMEMTTGNADNWGIGYYQYGKDGFGKAGFNGGVNLNDLLSPTAGTGATIGFGSGKSVTVTDPATKVALSIPSLVGFINFLKKTQKANILSTPQLTVLDNQEGEIEVGDQVVTGVNSSTGTNGTTVNSPIFADATIKLNLKPFISPSSNSIRMEIKQQVKQLSQANTPSALQSTTQPLATRSVKTVINVNNTDTAILGGLIREQDSETVQKVPLLGDIPILGWLFKSQTRQKDKVNLVVFITPKIIRNQTDQAQVLSKRLDNRLNFVKEQGGKDPFGSTVDGVYQKAQAQSKGSEGAPPTDGVLGE